MTAIGLQAKYIPSLKGEDNPLHMAAAASLDPDHRTLLIQLSYLFDQTSQGLEVAHQNLGVGLLNQGGEGLARLPDEEQLIQIFRNAL